MYVHHAGYINRIFNIDLSVIWIKNIVFLIPKILSLILHKCPFIIKVYFFQHKKSIWICTRHWFFETEHSSLFSALSMSAISLFTFFLLYQPLPYSILFVLLLYHCLAFSLSFLLFLYHSLFPPSRSLSISLFTCTCLISLSFLSPLPLSLSLSLSFCKKCAGGRNLGLCLLFWSIKA